MFQNFWSMCIIYMCMIYAKYMIYNIHCIFQYTMNDHGFELNITRKPSVCKGNCCFWSAGSKYHSSGMTKLGFCKSWCASMSLKLPWSLSRAPKNFYVINTQTALTKHCGVKKTFYWLILINIMMILNLYNVIRKCILLLQ